MIRFSFRDSLKTFSGAEIIIQNDIQDLCQEGYLRYFWA